ncbi:GNAT family N-acetyltransferase [Actinomadura rupiterrae]|uniref:GNAT family N-acetyltransferase n=1 Tax=Actinomadura rupiterrae TaxID=559627 RepID=UPI0026463FB4|nr:putative GNAT superfamily acetyltransferase [Actinomadura rupiterrae]
METRVRQAEPGDYDQIIGVVDGWWGRPIASVLPRLFLDHFHRTSLVAEDAEGTAGFLVGFLSPSEPAHAYIHFVGVAPRARGRGLARDLYRRFFDLAASDGRTAVRAITSPQNEGSIAFHTAMGFTVTGPVAGYDGPGVDRMVFERAL